MKKFAILAAVVLFAMPAFAQVKVANHGKVTTYEKGSTINVTSKDYAEVYYDGVLFTIPKGKKVVMSQNKSGDILISGDNLNGVKVLGQTLRSEKPATYVINMKRNTIIRAPIQTVSSKKEENKENKNLDTQAAGKETIVEVAFPEPEDYVNEIVSEQAVQDVEGQLSPSAPTGI
ncbi:MAG: hypothetical protein IKP23_02585 [Elusimicrobiaceae bacterium]|nr:hypothetical protein [Elusimicrobiaceae bacterium]